MPIDLFPTVLKDAVLSDDGVYRYRLTRTWNVNASPVTWIMLNPSTADSEVDDPTIRRCMSFARSWGFGGIVVVNCFALRATNPKELGRHHDPIGAGNGLFVRRAAEEAEMVVAAWGAHATNAAVSNVGQMVAAARKSMYCLGATKAGAPRHPLYVKGDQALVPWPLGEATTVTDSEVQ